MTGARPAQAFAGLHPTFDCDRDVLFLDLDGTLAGFAPRPQDVGPDPRRTAVLVALVERLRGRLAVISGRSVADVDRILQATVTAVAGVHGLERRTAAGRFLAAPVHAGLAPARVALQRFAAAHPGVLIEDKSASVALHYRAAPDLAEATLALGEDLSASTGLRLQRGAAVIELRAPGPDKGDAIAAFLGEAPFAGHRPVFVGDDVTDEDGFAFVEQSGGFGVLVGPPRETAASRCLPDIAAVLDWLEEIARA